MEKGKKNKEWYNNASLITTLIIGLIIIVMIVSQAFAVKNNIGAINTMKNLFNHNMIYIIGLIYFVLIKLPVGKKYFNIINLIYIAVYCLLLFAALLTIFQSFGIASLSNLLVNFIMLLYMIYTFLYETRLWHELKLDLMPFDELKNEWYFHSIVVLSILSLIVNLITVSNTGGIVLSICDTIYISLFARYIYLYKNYEDSKKAKVK